MRLKGITKTKPSIRSNANVCNSGGLKIIGWIFAGQFIRDNIIIIHAAIRPSESVSAVLQVNDTQRQISLALHSETESTNATLRETIRDPISKIVNAKEFPKDYFSTFKPNTTGNYTLTITNLGASIITIDGVFGFLGKIKRSISVH